VIGAAVARRYATALLEIGNESGSLATIVEEIARAAEAYQSSLELRNAIENPLVAHDAKKAILSDLADQLGVSVAVKNTLFLLCDRRRLRVLPAIAQLLREMRDLREGTLRAEVTTAARLGEDYYVRLQAQLERMTGKRVVIDRREDPSLIAGVVTRIGDMVIDGSLRSRLHELQNALMPN
jgi:F-type H+-transporting ATPase subunit delta